MVAHVIQKLKASNYIKHETKRNVLTRFIAVLIVFISYFTFVAYKYGVKDGLLIAFLSWSFFVFCTPVADAGFLLDFPIRLITGIKMWKSEIMVWVIAFLLNAYSMLFRREIYTTTKLLKVFNYIITHPIPFWLIILVSATGTFMSVYFGDELLDVIHHHQRKRYIRHSRKYLMILVFFLLVMIFALYSLLIRELGLEGLI